MFEDFRKLCREFCLAGIYGAMTEDDLRTRRDFYQLKIQTMISSETQLNPWIGDLSDIVEGLYSRYHRLSLFDDPLKHDAWCAMKVLAVLEETIEMRREDRVRNLDYEASMA